MSDAASYWTPLCTLTSLLKCWVRLAYSEDGSTIEGHWGQLLTIPTKGYLEGPGGPVRLRDVEWVEVSTSHIKGGMAGRPRQMIDIKDALLARLGETQLVWEIRESTWSREGVFTEEPVTVIRVFEPVGPTPIP